MDRPDTLSPELMRRRFVEHVRTLFQMDDTSGIELLSTLHRAANLSEVLECRPVGETDLSGPRFRLMLRLLIEEQTGNMGGVTPTALSMTQRVSKNTVSALLRGLEEQGLIQRSLDSQDLRVFRIQLTDAGRELVRRTAPKRMAGMNRLVAGLAPEEREQLTSLLEKLTQILIKRLKEEDLGTRINTDSRG